MDLTDLLKQTRVEGECRLWEGFIDRGRYAQIRLGGRLRMAPHVAYELAVGPVPEGSKFIRICPHRTCCNPHHVVLDTISMARLHQKGFSTVTWSKSRKRAMRKFDPSLHERLRDVFQSLVIDDENP